MLPRPSKYFVTETIGFLKNSLAMSDEAGDYITFTLDDNHTFACVFNSKASDKVTNISVVFYPYREMMQKGYRSWLVADELTLHQDTRYTVRFAKPQPVGEAKRAEAKANANRNPFDELFEEDAANMEADVPEESIADYGERVTIVGRYPGSG